MTKTTTATIKHKPYMSMIFIFCYDDNPTYYYDAAVIAISTLVAAILLPLLRLRMLLEIIASTKLFRLYLYGSSRIGKKRQQHKVILIRTQTETKQKHDLSCLCF